METRDRKTENNIKAKGTVNDVRPDACKYQKKMTGPSEKRGKGGSGENVTWLEAKIVKLVAPEREEREKKRREKKNERGKMVKERPHPAAVVKGRLRRKLVLRPELGVSDELGDGVLEKRKRKKSQKH